MNETKDLTKSTYNPMEVGGAHDALYDTIREGMGIADKYYRHGERGICFILADGADDWSKKTTINDVRDIVNSHQSNGLDISLLRRYEYMFFKEHVF